MLLSYSTKSLKHTKQTVRPKNSNNNKKSFPLKVLNESVRRKRKAEFEMTRFRAVWL